MIKLTYTHKESSALVVLAQTETSLNQLAGIESSYLSNKIKKEENGIAFNYLNNNLVFAVYANKSQKSESLKLQGLRVLGSQMISKLQGEEQETAQVIVDSAFSEAEAIAFLEGMVLGDYSFNNYKTKKSEKPKMNELFVQAEALSQAKLDELVHTSEGVFLARDLVNEPVITLTAPEFSNRMVAAGNDAGFTTTVLDKGQIEALKMGGLLGVNLGSDDPPTFNVMEYKPKNAVNEKPIVLVGKGVVYDTGGNNLKPGPYMLTMKSDMGGGAAVTGSIYAIAKNNLPLWVIALVPATDNRIGHNALVADDVITISDGTTVEVKNTDAEGRLILADALVYAKKYNPELVIDMATLTGAAEAITSHFGIASMGTADDDKKQSLQNAGELVYERLAEMPYWPEYDDLLKSKIADISNLGGPKGGAITAGKFLETFTDYPWIHLDIAGPAYLDAKDNYRPAGGTGVGVRLMYAFAKSRVKK